MDENTKIDEMSITDEFYNVWSTTKGKIVAKNLRKLNEGGVVLVIKELKEVIGFITENEIMAAVAKGENPNEMIASEIMNTDFMEVLANETLGNLLPKISKRYPNAIVVLNNDHKCVGFFSKNDYRDALAGLGHYDKSHAPLTPDEWRAKGIALSSKGNSEEALECYTKSLTTDSDNEFAWFKLAKRFEGAFLFKDALICYDKVLSINANNDQAWVNRGNIYYSQKTHKLAVQSYNLALTANPSNVDAMINMGLALSDLGYIDHALNYFHKVEVITGESAELWYRKGDVFEKAEKYTEALTCYDKAINLDNNYEEAWYGKGITLHKMGDNKQSLECLEMILKINPNNKVIGEVLGTNETSKLLELFPPNFE